jgi:hypothetical protein
MQKGAWIVGATIAGDAADTDCVAARWEGAANGAALGLLAAAAQGAVASNMGMTPIRGAPLTARCVANKASTP